MRSTTSVRVILAILGVLAVAGTLLSAPAQAAPAPQASQELTMRAPACLPRCWTAISFNPKTMRGGWTQDGNWGGKRAAMKSALRHCERRPVNAEAPRACLWPGKRDVYVRNGCVAVAKLVRNGRLIQWTIGKAYGPRKAMRLAKRKLDGTGTRSAGYSCSPRRF